MKNNEILEKFAQNKKILFLTPHMIYINTFLERYIINREIIFFENILLLILIISIITMLLQIAIKKITKNNQFVFCLSTIICLIYFMSLNLPVIITFLLCGSAISIIMVYHFKKYTDTFVGISLFIIIIYSIICSTPNICSIILNGINTKTYDETYEISVEENTQTPNIYWIHTDAMMNFHSIEKYFNYNNIELRKYLKAEGFQTNETASLISGNKTQNALAALLNPTYYDNFLKEYLYELEDVHLGKKKKTSFNISTKELADKRNNNQLIRALKAKKYTTIAISKFNNYSTINTDVFYDFYNNTSDHWHFTENKELRKISYDSIKKIENSYLLNQLKEGLYYTIFNSYTSKIIPYKYELMDYSDIDMNEYPIINKTNYWQIKAIIKSIEDTQTIDSNKFIFIDYDLNHTELSFDMNGKMLTKENYMNIHYYLENYIYSYRLLMEMIDYIKANDSGSVIIIQADHGLHTFEDEFLKSNFSIGTEELRDIRNSVMSAIYIPEEYKNGDEEYLKNPLNISRYLINNYVGSEHEYLKN